MTKTRYHLLTNFLSVFASLSPDIRPVIAFFAEIIDIGSNSKNL